MSSRQTDPQTWTISTDSWQPAGGRMCHCGVLFCKPDCIPDPDLDNDPEPGKKLSTNLVLRLKQNWGIQNPEDFSINRQFLQTLQYSSS